jgi:O-antigen ligase
LNAVQGTDTVWNNTIHTNNWYLETLVSFGLLGGLPFLVWLGLLGTDIVRTALRPAVNAWRLAAGAGLLAFMVHGLLDYFLLFNATALLFWMLAALWSGMRDDDARI